MNNQAGMSIERFKEEYEGQPAWDVGKPQKYFVEVFSESAPDSPVLDLGCGTGDLSEFVAGLGSEVLGVDFAPRAIDLAKERFSSPHHNLSFKVHDAFKLEELETKFGTILDCCFFHMLDDEARIKYSNILKSILKPGGKVYMLNFAVALPTPNAPRGVTESDIRSTFTEGWSITDIGQKNVDVTFLPEGLAGTYACIEKNA
ncbi:class I SAM-dependent methyltransferase [Oceanicoccus sp. KOV_DT_Chl]|uniref:class I SAM-dependent methyltransferase n=1 Tax=Oceanicoccus sp. KOV_DT_Chl TaxID=1904639 RepID=UPI000C7A2AA4|nr:class I SAM-dependent methyltransferase [Oceanicoccus sp. KOV_DT_Chl]